MTKPSPEEVEKYALEIGFKLDGNYFCDFYQSKGWCVGKSPMKDWKAAVRTWKRMAAPSALISGHHTNNEVPRYDPEKIEKRKKELEEIREREWQRRMGEQQESFSVHGCINCHVCNSGCNLCKRCRCYVGQYV